MQTVENSHLSLRVKGLSVFVLSSAKGNGGINAGIAKGLTEDGVKTPSGKDIWKRDTLFSILSNEKYKGDALLQKTFTIDYLTKKMKVNEGEVPQYYVTGSHPAIIDPKEWDMVQLEMKRREKAQT